MQYIKMNVIERLERHAHAHDDTYTFTPDNKIGAGGMGAIYREVVAGTSVAVKVQPISDSSVYENQSVLGIKPVHVEYDQDTTIEVFDAFGRKHVSARSAKECTRLKSATAELKGLLEDTDDDSIGFISQNFYTVDGFLFAQTYLDNVEDAQTLDEFASSREVTLREKYEVIYKLGKKLEAWSKRGIIHRDLKPSNVMIGPDRRVIVLDFGLSTMSHYRRLPNEPDDVKRLLQKDFLGPHSFTGTPGYTPMDEVIFGQPTHYLDTYSYGMVAASVILERNPLHPSNEEDGMAFYNREAQQKIMRECALVGAPEPFVEALGKAIEVSPPREYRDLMWVAKELSEMPSADVVSNAPEPEFDETPDGTVPGRKYKKRDTIRLSRASTILLEPRSDVINSLTDLLN